MIEGSEDGHHISKPSMREGANQFVECMKDTRPDFMIMILMRKSSPTNSEGRQLDFCNLIGSACIEIALVL